MTAPPGLPVPGSQTALRAIKAIHTLVWFSIEGCMMYVLYAGFARRSDRRAGIAAGVVAAESLIFVGNRCRCPLTTVAERLGIERGSFTDIYLPRWLAHSLPAIHVPLICLATFLHARNLRAKRCPWWPSATGHVRPVASATPTACSSSRPGPSLLTRQPGTLHRGQRSCPAMAFGPGRGRPPGKPSVTGTAGAKRA